MHPRLRPLNHVIAISWQPPDCRALEGTVRTMTRLLGSLMLVLTVIFAIGASAQGSVRCHIREPIHAAHVAHSASDTHLRAAGADHAAMPGHCKLVCGTVAMLMPSSSPVQVAHPAVQEPLPDDRPVLSLMPAPSERPPRSLI